MEKIKFSSGTMVEFAPEYYELNLFNKEGNKVYSATIPRLEAAGIISKHSSIKMVSEGN